MAKRQICEDMVGTGKGAVRLVGWGSSLLDEASDPSPKHLSETPISEIRPETFVDDGRVSPEVRDRVKSVMARNDRRRQRRLAQTADVNIQQFSCDIGGVISAEVLNFSRGGICIASPVPMVGNTVVQCQIGVLDLHIAIPTLMQVVWVEQTCASQFEIGLRYLF
jgi:hypothetical protein